MQVKFKVSTQCENDLNWLQNCFLHDWQYEDKRVKCMNLVNRYLLWVDYKTYPSTKLMYKYQRHHNKIIYIENLHSTVVYFDNQVMNAKPQVPISGEKRKFCNFYLEEYRSVDLKFYTNDVVLFKCIRRIFR